MKSAGYILPLVCAALFLTAYRSTAQPSLYANPFIEQIEHYPQEKLHVSTDKDSYIAGDTIWLRAHCADAAKRTVRRWCGGSNSCRATACAAATFPRSHWNA